MHDLSDGQHQLQLSVTYRDDLAAAQARADALERENARLRDEKAELELTAKAARAELVRRDSEPVALEPVTPATAIEKLRIHSIGILMVGGLATAGIGVIAGPVVCVVGIAMLFAGLIILQVWGD